MASMNVDLHMFFFFQPEKTSEGMDLTMEIKPLAYQCDGGMDF
jgi:hypothetical protein